MDVAALIGPIIFVVINVIVSGPYLVSAERARRRMHPLLLRRSIEAAGGHAAFKVGHRGFVWAPGIELGPQSYLLGKARAEYSLLDHEWVRLRYLPAYGAHEQDYSGPFPTQAAVSKLRLGRRSHRRFLPQFWLILLFTVFGLLVIVGASGGGLLGWAGLGAAVVLLVVEELLIMRFVHA